ncbi:MAG: aminotransferase class IV [Anaerohalosphaeraceae bacterium]|nr:aminotransferase class IV [Anaerohalosphaeraceae bacterium]
MPLAMIDNKIVELDQLDPACLDRGTFFGDGVYEALRSYNGKLFALDEHLVRFERSLSEIEIGGVDIEDIRRKVIKVYELSGISNAKIYFHITRGTGPREHFSRELTPRFFLTITDAPDGREAKTNGISVISTPDTRWKRCDIKTLNLLPNVLAKSKAEKNGCEEAIFVNDDDLLTEGTSSAFFAFFTDILRTTPLSANILSSVTREFVLKACQNLGICVEEKSVALSEVPKADEMFIAMSSKNIVPIVRFDSVKIGNGTPGKNTKLLIAEFANLVTQHCQNF